MHKDCFKCWTSGEQCVNGQLKEVAFAQKRTESSYTLDCRTILRIQWRSRSWIEKVNRIR